MADCKTCWGTGFVKGWGAPCPEGCKPPIEKKGLAASADPKWRKMGDDETFIERCRQATKDIEAYTFNGDSVILDEHPDVLERQGRTAPVPRGTRSA